MAQSQQSQSTVRSRRNVKSAEDLQKLKRHSQNVLRKEQREIQRDRNRNLFDSCFMCYSDEDQSVVERVFEQLRSQCVGFCESSGGDEVDFGIPSSSDGSSEIDVAVKCLKFFEERLHEENQIPTAVSDIHKPCRFSYSSTIQYFINNSKLEYIVSLMNNDLINCCEQSKRSLLKEVINLIYLITVFVKSDHDKLQLILETKLHSHLLSILNCENWLPEIELCTKVFVCLTLVGEKIEEFRTFLTCNDYTELIFKHSQNASKTPKENELILNYVQAISWSLSLITKKLGDKLTDTSFMVHTLTSLNILMQLDDDFLLTNLYWVFSSLIVPGSLCNSDYIENSGLIPKLCNDLDGRWSEDLKDAAITSLANITVCSEHLSAIVFNANILRFEFIEKLVNSNSSILQHQLVIVLKNIVNAVPLGINNITKCGGSALLLDLLHFGEYKSRREVTYLLRNMVLNGTVEDVVELLDKDIISALSTQINVTEPDLVLATLNIYERMLFLEKNHRISFAVAEKCNEYGVVDKMDLLCQHGNQIIVDSVCRIHDNYFDHSDSTENFAPLFFNF